MPAALPPALPWACLVEQAHPKGAVSVPAFVVIDSPSSPGEWGELL
jgi:hypothetical protein